MNISLSNGNSFVAVASPKMGRDRNALAGNRFDRQLAALQERLNRLSEDESMDEETKQNMINEIEEQMEALQELRREQQLEEMNRRTERMREQASQTSSNSSNGDDNGVTFAMTNAIVSGSVSMDSIRQTNAQRVDIIGQMRVAGEDPIPDRNGSGLQQALYRVTQSMFQQMGEANANVYIYNDEIMRARANENANSEDSGTLVRDDSGNAAPTGENIGTVEVGGTSAQYSNAVSESTSETVVPTYSGSTPVSRNVQVNIVV